MIRTQTFESGFIVFISDFFYLRFYLKEKKCVFKAKLYSTFHIYLQVISLHLPLYTKPAF